MYLYDILYLCVQKKPSISGQQLDLYKGKIIPKKDKINVP